MRLRPVQYLLYLLVRVFICVVQAMSMESCRTMARLLATVATRFVPLRRQVIDENLRHAFPSWSAAQRRQVSWRMWEHLVLMVAEIAHTPRKIRDTNWRRYLRLKNSRELLRLLLAERPSVLVSGHFGNFEIAGYMLGLYGVPTFTIARPLDNPYLDRFLNEFRRATGQQILPKRGSATDVARLLECNGALLLLGDQAAGAKACWVDFFGRPASVHKAIAVFALGNNAPLAVCYSRRLGRPMQFEIGTTRIIDPADGLPESAGTRELSATFTGELESIIRQATEQYWWVHRRWKDPRGRKRRGKLKTTAARRAA